METTYENKYNVAVHLVVGSQKPTNENELQEKLNLSYSEAHDMLVQMHKEGILTEMVRNQYYVMVEKPYFGLTKKERKLLEKALNEKMIQTA